MPDLFMAGSSARRGGGGEVLTNAETKSRGGLSIVQAESHRLVGSASVIFPGLIPQASFLPFNDMSTTTHPLNNHRHCHRLNYRDHL